MESWADFNCTNNRKFMEAVCMPKDFDGWCVYLVCGVFISSVTVEMVAALEATPIRMEFY